MEVTVGMIGLGNVGAGALQILTENAGGIKEKLGFPLRVAAVCSRDKAKLAGDWTGTRGNFGPPPGHVDLTGVGRYETLTELIADPARIFE